MKSQIFGLAEFRDPASILVAAKPRRISGLAKVHRTFSPLSPPNVNPQSLGVFHLMQKW
jgi:hypothetical protein